MRWCWSVAILVVTAPNAEAAAPAQLITATERAPLAFILNTPTGAIANTSSSEVIRIVGDFFRRETSLTPQLIESDVVRSCQGQITCLVLAARPDYERNDLRLADGQLVPYREHVRRLKKAGETYARYLFMLSNVTVPGRPDRMTALLVDTDLALGLYHRTVQKRAGWKEDLEAQIATRAVPIPEARAVVKDAESARQFLEQVLTRDYVGTFEESGHWRPYGTLDLVTDIANMEVSIDGLPIGSTAVGVTRITKLLPGTRSVVLRHPDFAVATAVATVRRQETTSLEPELIRIASDSIKTERNIVLYSGIGIGTVGVGLLAFAVVRAASSPRRVCITAAGTGCGSRFQTTGFDGSAMLNEAPSLNPGGVLVGPLGAALATTGATFTLGVLLSDDSATPWWYALLGGALGGAIYGTSILLD